MSDEASDAAADLRAAVRAFCAKECGTSEQRAALTEGGRLADSPILLRRFAELGLAGFVLKSHYTSTAERAAVVRGAVPEVTVLGAIALNRAVGGINPLAVEIAARVFTATAVKVLERDR